MSREIYLTQNWAAIVFSSLIISFVLAAALFALCWGWFVDWPKTSTQFYIIWYGMVDHIFGDSTMLSSYFELLERRELITHFYLKTLTIGISSLFIGISLSLRMFYVPGGVPTDVFLCGQKLIYKRAARAKLKTYSRKFGEQDSLAVHPYLKIPTSKEIGNFFIYGQQGSGKSVIVKGLINQIFERGDKAIIYDEKREYTELFLGKESFLISPTDARSVFWDIAADINSEEKAFLLAECLLPNSSSNEDFWVKGARTILAGCVIYLMKNNSQWSWRDLGWILQLPLDAMHRKLLVAFPSAANLVEADSKTTQGFMVILSTELNWLFVLSEMWVDKGKKISVTQWLNDPSAPRFLIIPSDPLHKSISGPICVAIISLAVEQILSMPDAKSRRVWLTLDELGNLPQNPSLLRGLTLGRSKGLRTIAGIQAISQLRSMYGADASETLLTLFATVIALRVGAPGDSSQAASKALGRQRVVRPIVTLDGNGSRSTSYQQVDEPTVSPEAISRLPDPHGKGVSGFLSVSGLADTYQLVWPYPNLQIIATGYEAADWLTPKAKKPRRGRKFTGKKA